MPAIEVHSISVCVICYICWSDFLFSSQCLLSKSSSVCHVALNAANLLAKCDQKEKVVANQTNKKK